MDVGGVAQLVDDLECGRLLPLKPVWIDGIDEGDGMAFGQFADDPQTIVEVPVDGDERGAVDDRLSKLPGGDLSRGQDDGGAQTGGCRIGGGRSRRVARRGARDDFCVGCQHLGNGGRHSAVFEGARGVGAFDLDVDASPRSRVKGAGADERGSAFLQGDDRIAVVEGKPIGILANEPLPLMRHQASSTRLTL